MLSPWLADASLFHRLASARLVLARRKGVVTCARRQMCTQYVENRSQVMKAGEPVSFLCNTLINRWSLLT